MFTFYIFLYMNHGSIIYISKENKEKTLPRTNRRQSHCSAPVGNVYRCWELGRQGSVLRQESAMHHQ